MEWNFIQGRIQPPWTRIGSLPAMRLFSYILRVDSGFAPNPFHGLCTLACCKPVIRRTASTGDLIVGLTPASVGHRLAYAMKIGEVLPFDCYWKDARFRSKRPQWSSPRKADWIGDNCYEPMADGGFRQLPSAHSKGDGSDDAAKKQWDLSGRNVLVGSRFWYFGREAVELPSGLEFLVVGRGHRSRFTEAQISKIVAFLEGFPEGIHASPSRWPESDNSWDAMGTPSPRGCR
jgi:hypothetical protein